LGVHGGGDVVEPIEWGSVSVFYRKSCFQGKIGKLHWFNPNVPLHILAQLSGESLCQNYGNAVQFYAIRISRFC
jgi:hypothetical protein